MITMGSCCPRCQNGLPIKVTRLVTDRGRGSRMASGNFTTKPMMLYIRQLKTPKIVCTCVQRHTVLVLVLVQRKQKQKRLHHSGLS